MKTCSKCKEEKKLTLEFFKKRKDSKDGWRANCRDCGNEHRRKWRSGKGLANVSWEAMIARCHNPNNDSYKNYGAKGVVVCEEWRNSYHKFLKDMGERPSQEHSIDRIDNNKGYYKENCKWSDKFEQAQNRPMMSTNTSGHTGVYWEKENKNWRARIRSKGKDIGLGSYKNIEDAIEARRQGVLKYHNKHS